MPAPMISTRLRSPDRFSSPCWATLSTSSGTGGASSGAGWPLGSVFVCSAASDSIRRLDVQRSSVTTPSFPAGRGYGLALYAGERACARGRGDLRSHRHSRLYLDAVTDEQSPAHSDAHCDANLGLHNYSDTCARDVS